MAGLVPDIRPEIFDRLKTIAVAMDAAANDQQNTGQALLRQLRSLLLNGSIPYDVSTIVAVVEEMILVAVRCGSAIENRDVMSRAVERAAKARQYKQTASEQIDEIIALAVSTRYPSLNSGSNTRYTAHGIATRIKGDVSRLLKERNIRYLRERELGESAITKRVKKLLSSWTAD
jgi:hypothetical protein